MWIGQCRVEAMTAEGSGLQLDGLRLSLDLRLPATSRNGTRRAVPSRRLRWLLAGLGSLALLAVGWWWHAGSPRSEAPIPPPRAPASDRAAAPPLSLPAPAPAAAPPAAQSELAGAAGAHETLPPEAAVAGEQRSPATPIVTIRPIASREAAGAGVAARQAPAPERRTGREAAGASGSLPARAPARTADADQLELFDDTK